MKNRPVTPLVKETFLAAVKNSVRTNTFRHLYAKVGSKKLDIAENGRLSCAFFVSSILTIFGLITSVHATVDGTNKDLGKSGWKRTKKPVIGSVIIWGLEKSKEGDIHRHIGFYIGNGKVVSNNSALGRPAIHDWAFGSRNGIPKRKIEAIFRHQKLS